MFPGIGASGYFCLGYPQAEDAAQLERVGWEQRRPAETVFCTDDELATNFDQVLLIDPFPPVSLRAASSRQSPRPLPFLYDIDAKLTWATKHPGEVTVLRLWIRRRNNSEILPEHTAEMRRA